MKLPDVKTTVIDRVVNYFSPVKGQQRYYARARMALAGAYASTPGTGGYSGASKKRRALTEWDTAAADADDDTLPDLPLLRERSRDLIRNSPLAAGAIHTKVTNTIGTGLRMNSRIDREALGLADDEADAWEAQAEREWRLWSENRECDIERTLSFRAMQDLVFRSTLESGDVFVLLPFAKRKGNPYGLKLQVIEADRVCNPEFKQDDDKMAAGIERSNTGAPEAYHICNTHPDNYRDPGNKTWKRIGAYGKKTGRRNVLHLYRKIRPGQSRGVPDLAPVIETLKQLDRYTEAEVMAAVISGMFTVFIRSEAGDGLSPMEPTTETGGKTTDKDYKLSYGAILELASDESIEQANPTRPSQSFDPFVMSVLRQIGVALELPFEVLIKHFTASYSAAQAAILEAWRYFLTRREWLASNFCQPVYEAFLYEAVARGRLAAPGFLQDPLIRQAYSGAEWIGPARGHIDEVKAIRAAKLRIAEGVSTISQETAQINGGDFERNHRQRVKENNARREDGLLVEVVDAADAPPGESTEDN